MTWRRVLFLTGVAALLLLTAYATLLLGERFAWPRDRVASVAGVLAFAGLVVFQFGSLAPGVSWVLLPLYEGMLGPEDRRLAMLRFLSPPRRGRGRG